MELVEVGRSALKNYHNFKTARLKQVQASEVGRVLNKTAMI